jgi:hypothetical protein
MDKEKYIDESIIRLNQLTVTGINNCQRVVEIARLLSKLKEELAKDE